MMKNLIAYGSKSDTDSLPTFVQTLLDNPSDLQMLFQQTVRLTVPVSSVTTIGPCRFIRTHT